MADSEGVMSPSETMDRNTLNTSYRPSIARIQNAHSPTPYSSSSVEPASILDSRDTLSEGDTLVRREIITECIYLFTETIFFSL